MSMTIGRAICLLCQMYLPQFDEEEKQALTKAIESLEKVQQFEAIGTVEEFKALKEKNEPKKPVEQIKLIGLDKGGKYQ